MNNYIKLAYEAGAQQAIKEAREGWNVRDPDDHAPDFFRVSGGVSGVFSPKRLKDPDPGTYGKAPGTFLSTPTNFGLDLIPTDPSVYDENTGEVKGGFVSTVLSSLLNPAKRKDRRDSREVKRLNAKDAVNRPPPSRTPPEGPLPEAPGTSQGIPNLTPKNSPKNTGRTPNYSRKAAAIDAYSEVTASLFGGAKLASSAHRKAEIRRIRAGMIMREALDPSEALLRDNARAIAEAEFQKLKSRGVPLTFDRVSAVRRDAFSVASKERLILDRAVELRNQYQQSTGRRLPPSSAQAQAFAEFRSGQLGGMMEPGAEIAQSRKGTISVRSPGAVLAAPPVPEKFLLEDLRRSLVRARAPGIKRQADLVRRFPNDPQAAKTLQALKDDARRLKTEGLYGLERGKNAPATPIQPPAKPSLPTLSQAGVPSAAPRVSADRVPNRGATTAVTGPPSMSPRALKTLQTPPPVGPGSGPRGIGRLSTLVARPPKAAPKVPASPRRAAPNATLEPARAATLDISKPAAGVNLAKNTPAPAPKPKATGKTLGSALKFVASRGRRI